MDQGSSPAVAAAVVAAEGVAGAGAAGAVGGIAEVDGKVGLDMAVGIAAANSQQG